MQLKVRNPEGERTLLHGETLSGAFHFVDFFVLNFGWSFCFRVGRFAFCNLERLVRTPIQRRQSIDASTVFCVSLARENVSCQSIYMAQSLSNFSDRWQPLCASTSCRTLI